MSQATSKKPSAFSFSAHLQRSLREALLYLSLGVAVYLFMALMSYSPQDPGWTLVGEVGHVQNAGGRVGAWLADVLLSLFGYLAYLLLLGIAYLGVLFYRKKAAFDLLHVLLRGMGFIATLAAGTGLASLHLAPFSPLPLGSGGILGSFISQSLVEALNPIGASLFLWTLFFTGFTLLTGLSWLHVVDALGLWALRAYGWAKGAASRWRRPEIERPRAKPEVKTAPQVRIEPKFQPPPPPPPKARAKPRPSPSREAWHMPLDLLDTAEPQQGGFSSHTLEEMAEQVELRLRDFGIQVKVVAVQPGPVITRFELEPAPGLKASRITNLSRDLARALAVRSVRVVEVIPGKSVIGLEIPNEERETVRLAEIFQSEAYARAHSPLTLALGKDVEGKPVVANLARMPHLLVAGTTGSGKSVAINAMLLSLLHNAPPEEVRLILVDPKMLELSFYEGIPHLLAPVVTDMKEAANALRWCVAEMDRRYRLMAAAGVRNLAGFNRKVREEGVTGSEGEPLSPLPYIVVVVDELADMMMVVGKKVEEFIARLAQKARAAGIHLILATQRPSVDVITGLIKANIPARIAFQVSSRIDSRTILDQMGAEQLLGQGDMLYLPPGTGFPIRVHGAFVADQEVHRFVEHLKGLGEPDYHEEVLAGLEEEGPVEAGASEAEADPLYDQAVRIVTETRRASVSGVQRRLKIGYNRAARLIEAMEHAGIVGPLQPNGSREVLAPPPVEP